MGQIETLYALGFALVVIGIVIISIALVLQISKHSKTKSETRAGGVVLIGPIPIVFGTDKESLRKTLWLSVVLSAIVLAILIVIYFLQAEV